MLTRAAAAGANTSATEASISVTWNAERLVLHPDTGDMVSEETHADVIGRAEQLRSLNVPCAYVLPPLARILTPQPMPVLQQDEIPWFASVQHAGSGLAAKETSSVSGRGALSFWDVARISNHDEIVFGFVRSDWITQMCTSLESLLMRPKTAPLNGPVGSDRLYDCWISGGEE